MEVKAPTNEAPKPFIPIKVFFTFNGQTDKQTD